MTGLDGKTWGRESRGRSFYRVGMAIDYTEKVEQALKSDMSD